MVKPQTPFHRAAASHSGCVSFDDTDLKLGSIRCYRCFSLPFSLESAAACAASASVSFLGKIHARAAAAVPSPLCLEKQRKVAQTKAQQPVKVVRTYSGTRAKFRNWGEAEGRVSVKAEVGFISLRIQGTSQNITKAWKVFLQFNLKGEFGM